MAWGRHDDHVVGLGEQGRYIRWVPLPNTRRQTPASLPEDGHRRAALLQQVLPELAEQIRAEAGWAALAATLDDVRRAGHDPAVLLADAARRRELDTADSISDVLVWRLRRSAHLLALPASPDGTATMGTRRSAPLAPVTQPATSAVNDPSRRR